MFDPVMPMVLVIVAGLFVALAALLCLAACLAAQDD
jgi:hypothetical protein